ncbi:hypothetical protein ABES80_13485 [Bacillus gobiensis]|uniref:hypothetical protein n=1 Tax=Bacillus gobiensis TaxID=1441095 RepID=UPI003D1B45A5
MNGIVWSNIGVINNSFGAYFSTIVGTRTATNIENSVSITAYGLAGAGGIGKVYEDKLTSSNENQDTHYSDMSDTFTASVAYSTVVAETTVSMNLVRLLLEVVEPDKLLRRDPHGEL